MTAEEEGTAKGASRYREFRTPSPPTAIALGGGVTVIVLMPLFLTGALAVQLTEELAFGSAALGVAVGAFRVSASITSPYLGLLTDRLGAIRSLRIAVLIASVSSLGIASTANRWSVFVAWMLLAGTALAVAQPAANRLLSNVITQTRLGMAFGLKQSAPPIASMLAGVSVPLIGVTLGWRWAFLIAAAVGVPAVFAIGKSPPRRPGRAVTKKAAKEPLANIAVIVMLTTSFALATFTSASLTTFYVVSSVHFGSTPETAGVVLAAASLVAIISRITAGAVSDRLSFSPLYLCAAMLLVGAVGTGMVATGTPGLMGTGLVIGLSLSWGFNGVFWYVLVRSFPEAPGRITGMVAPGGLLGASLGPMAFGVIAQTLGYRVGWSVATAVTVAAAVVMALTARQLP